MKTVGELLNDPNSNLSKNMAKARETMRENDEKIKAWMALGYSHEEAWRKALFG